MTYFSELLKDRNNPYEIDLELSVRKIFEKNTDYTYEFQKNIDPYGYDISVFKYDINGADWAKRHICYVEVEISETWIDVYPKNWMKYSFLARKVYKDIENSVLKDEHKKTCYVIFNKTLTDSICQSIETISTFNLEYQEISGKKRNDYYLRTYIGNQIVCRGVKNSLNFIYKFIKDKERQL